MPTRVVAYVDGLNLYSGLKAAYGRKYLWHDPEILAGQLIRPNQRLERVRLFSARFRWPDEAVRDQAIHLDALTTHCSRLELIEGRFQEKSVQCQACGGESVVYEEKETDINIALGMVEDAATKSVDVALLVSADSDLCPAVRAVRRINARCRIVAAFPPRRNSNELRQTADAAFTIREHRIRNALLPEVVADDSLASIKCPSTWR